MKIFITKQYNPIMAKFFIFLFLFHLSCSAPKAVIEDISFSTIYYNSNGGTEKPSHQHITNNEAYINLIETLKIDESEFNKLVAVNFKENDILVLFQGKQNTGGYAIELQSIRWENQVLMIQKKETFPEAGKPVTMVITSPYCISVIPKAKKIILLE